MRILILLFALLPSIESSLFAANLKENQRILLVGPLGSGKSSCLNRLLDLEDKDRAETGVGKAVTKKISPYADKGSPLTIYDSPGLNDGNEQDLTSELVEFVASEKITGLLFLVNAGAKRVDIFKNIVKFKKMV